MSICLEICLNADQEPLPIGLQEDDLTRSYTNRANAYCTGISQADCGRCNPVLFYQFYPDFTNQLD